MYETNRANTTSPLLPQSGVQKMGGVFLGPYGSIVELLRVLHHSEAI